MKRTPLRLATAALLLMLAGAPAVAEWLQPDASLRDAQFMLRTAIRDTVGHGSDPERLDSLGVALLRLARFDDAGRIFRRSLEQRPQGAVAAAGLGKLALFAGRLSEAESLFALSLAIDRDPVVVRDQFAGRLQRRDWAGAAALAADADEQGRQAALEAMAEQGAYRVTAGPDEVRIPWIRTYPVPLVRARLNGESVLLALDTGAADLLIDESWARRVGIRLLPSESRVFWSGTRIAVQNALIPRLELGPLRIESVPAGVTSLGKWSLLINPQAEPVAGVIGLRLLQSFTPTLDYHARVLWLRRSGHPPTFDATAQRIPFEIWGEAELTVYGTLAGGRRMAMVVQSGLPECGVAAPTTVFEEIGLKSGTLSRAASGLGTYLQGRPWQRVTVPTVVVGPMVADRVPGWSGAMDAAEIWRHGVRRDAILSHDVFAGRRVTFDWQARELVVESRGRR